MRYYVDQEVDDDTWYVFDSKTETHKAIASYASKDEAIQKCNDLNGSQ